MRRQQPHPIQLPPVKPPLNIEEWEAKAPLTDVELGSVRDIKAACEARRLPAKVSATLQRAFPPIHYSSISSQM